MARKAKTQNATSAFVFKDSSGIPFPNAPTPRVAPGTKNKAIPNAPTPRVKPR